jgi:hypothetical protein
LPDASRYLARPNPPAYQEAVVYKSPTEKHGDYKSPLLEALRQKIVLVWRGDF